MSEVLLQLGDPLPRRRLTGAPAAGGVIKARPEDFIVDELPLYEPIGEGEHLYLRVQKRNLAHNEMTALLQRHYDVREEAIGFAGMKDKVGVTRQNVSIHLPGRPDVPPPAHAGLSVLWSARHTNKLRRGHLLGNRFSIRIRGIEPAMAPLIKERLDALERIGIPDYYGYQRFGYRRNNHVLGMLLLRERWDDVLRELLGPEGSSFPAHQRLRRELFLAGRHEEGAPLWSRGDRAERAAIEALRQGASSREAVMAIGMTTLSFWTSALQSFVFNRVLDRRIDEGTLDRLIEGDVAWKHSSQRCFLVGPEEAADPVLHERTASFELSPSGPLFGAGMVRPAGDVAAAEAEVLAEHGLDAAIFEHERFGASGARRPMRVQVSRSSADAGFDAHGPFVRVSFDLPRGAYATVVLRELIGPEAED